MLHFKRWLVLILNLSLIILVVVPFCGCAGPRYVKLTMDNLKDKRIGVMCGYSSDYIFYDTELKKFGMQLTVLIIMRICNWL
jgi:hypothetical protein